MANKQEEKIEEVVTDNQPVDITDIEATIKRIHGIVKSKIIKTDDVTIKPLITKAELAGVDQFNTKDFRTYAFRQGAANQFPETMTTKEKD